MELIRHSEGKTVLLVPRASLEQIPPPTSPIFFNPAASLNRDITVAITSADGGSTFCDSMAGVGARGLRVASEVKDIAEVSLVDFNGGALAAARRASVLNRVRRKCEFTESETSSYLFSRLGRDQRFDYVDIDPFGSPIRQIQAALSATSEGGILSLTATDTAVLSGVHRVTCQRRYWSFPLNNHFNHETGIRILVGVTARLGASFDIGIEPVAAHSTKHYVRVFLRVEPGASKADFALTNLGSTTWCPSCGETRTMSTPESRCSQCGMRTKVAGPLWVGNLAQEEIIQKARKEASARGYRDAEEILESLIGVNRFPPWSFSIERICSVLKVPSVPESAVYRYLLGSGRRVMRTPFEKAGLKTDARFSEVVEAVKSSRVGR